MTGRSVRGPQPRSSKRVLAAILVLLAISALSCISGTRLRSVAARPGDAQGTYTVLLHGCRYGNDLETMALLVDRTSPYRFRIVDLPSSTKTLPSLTADQAAKEAEAFIRCSIYNRGKILFRRILDPLGETIAFEVKPLYSRIEMGAEEVVLSDYFLHGDEVRVYLRLDPAVEREQQLDINAIDHW